MGRLISQGADRGGRPRRRFLAQRRQQLASALVPNLGAMAAACAIFAVLDFVGLGASRNAVVPEATAALVLGGCAMAAAYFQRSLAMLTVLSVFGPSCALVAAGWMVRATGGDNGPIAILVGFVAAVVMGFVHLSFRGALVVSIVACVSQLVSGVHSLFPAVIVVATCGGGLLAARVRHRRAIDQFRRIERLTAALKRLRSLQDQLVVVEKLEALRVLVGGMAHELNNALAVALVSAQQAAKEVPEGPGKAALLRTDGGLQRIKRTVDRLRRFAMAEGAILEPADVGAMLDFALESAIGRARSGVIVERAYDPSVGSLEIHVAALAEALFQVAKNAVEAMPGGGRIQAAVRREGDRIVLAVSDQGRGIPPEELVRVFDPFYTRAKGHAGFGLSAVYGLVSSLGGRVEINSEVGKGTEVSILLPARQASIRPPS
jgi:signal transduction histidine kinase